jgi:hypothetical protein
MVRTLRFPAHVLLASFLLIFASGCPELPGDGLVAVSGWIVPGEGPRSEFVPSETEPDEPDQTIRQAHVELWTADGRERLDRWEYPRGDYSVAHIGPYFPRLEYLLKAGAPGYAPVKQKIFLKKMKTVFRNIVLVPRAGPRRQDHE